MELEIIFDETAYSDKELYRRKRLPETAKKLDEFLQKNAPDFYSARKALDFEAEFRFLCRDMQINLDDKPFVYFFDFNYPFNTDISNLTPDYSLILGGGIRDMKYDTEEGRNGFFENGNSVIDSLLLLIDRVVEKLEEERPDGFEAKSLWFRNMKDKPAATFCEALQRLLFLNQMLWQTGSRLVGLGRLDVLLYPYYAREQEKGILTKKLAADILKDVMKCLHGHYWFKSSALLGDTGQVIVIGGSDREGRFFRNDLTDIFLELGRELQLPDPKIVLRVNRNIPQDLLDSGIRCMMTGTGSPLLSNDDVIIPVLLEFGIEEADAYDYATSACWEPLIGGRSSSMNNVARLSYMKALDNLLMEERLGRFQDFEALKCCYLQYLKREIRGVERQLYERRYRKNTLYSVFMEGCRESGKDIVEGGAKYHNIGITTIALGNTVNALLNIQRYVFEERRYELVDVKKISLYDYEGYEETAGILKTNEAQYGCDSEEVISLSNELLRFVSKETEEFRLPDGGRLKFGSSSPSFIMEGCSAAASFDGRRKGDPFQVHISNENISSYTEIIHFAASLDYGGNRFNGNVVDFMVSPSFVQENFEKFALMIRRGIEAGFFQLQMNVVDSNTLLEAKRNPDAFPQLLVRVWGFSAYFVELPESYQDLLIERALRNEGKR